MADTFERLLANKLKQKGITFLLKVHVNTTDSTVGLNWSSYMSLSCPNVAILLSGLGTKHHPDYHYKQFS